MTTEIEADLRREFDAASMPSGLTFSPESIVRQGNRTIHRRRLIAGGSAAIAVGLVAVGANLVTRPHDSAVPLPASHNSTTGIVRAQSGNTSGMYDVEFNRDTRVRSNVRYFFTPLGGQKTQVGSSSSAKAGQKPDATWRSGVVGGHPFTIGLVPTPARNLGVTFTDGASYGFGLEELKGTGYMMFYVGYNMDPTRKPPPRPSDIASIRWTGPTGIVDGIEGDHRLTGRALIMGTEQSVQVVLGRGEGGRTTVFGQADVLRDSGGGGGMALSVATADPLGVAVVTGRQPTIRTNSKGMEVLNSGPPVAAGILPPGSTDLGVILTKGYAPFPIVVSEVMPDGRVIFAITAEGADPSIPSKDSIKAVTWTNASGSQSRMDVTQKQS